ncbi:MAG: nicotinate-nucleotide adenylyltransferase [Phototrophicaceae bacterium]
MKRIGVLGGTFDPPHIGHLLLAEYTLEALSLDMVLFVPTVVQPLKPDMRSITNHRLNMVKLAIEGNPHFAISRADIDRSGPHYTADTLPIIQEEYPDSDLFFLMGGDSLRDFTKWIRADEIADHARLAVMRRSDEAISAEMHDDVIPNLSKHIDIIDTPLLSIWLSSTHVVERLKNQQSVRYLVPDAILDYINAHNLYAESL